MWTAAAASLSLMMLGSVPGAAATYESRVTLLLPDTVITSAVSVPGPSFTAPNEQTYEGVPPFLPRHGGLDVEQRFPDQHRGLDAERGLERPIRGDRQRRVRRQYALDVPEIIPGVRAGRSVAATDMGTAPSTNKDADVLVGHPQKWIDSSHRHQGIAPMTTRERSSWLLFPGPASTPKGGSP